MRQTTVLETATQERIRRPLLTSEQLHILTHATHALDERLEPATTWFARFTRVSMNKTCHYCHATNVSTTFEVNQRQCPLNDSHTGLLTSKAVVVGDWFTSLTE